MSLVDVAVIAATLAWIVFMPSILSALLRRYPRLARPFWRLAAPADTTEDKDAAALKAEKEAGDA